MIYNVNIYLNEGDGKKLVSFTSFEKQLECIEYVKQATAEYNALLEAGKIKGCYHIDVNVNFFKRTYTLNCEKKAICTSSYVEKDWFNYK